MELARAKEVRGVISQFSDVVHANKDEIITSALPAISVQNDLLLEMQ